MTLGGFFVAILRKSPGAILAATAFLTFASLLEVIGLAAVIPILSRFFESAGLLGGVVGRVMTALGLAQVSLEVLLVVLVALIVARSALLFAAGALVGRIAVTMERRYRRELMSRYLQADWTFHLDQKAGWVTNLITREARRARMAAIQAGNHYSHMLIAGVFLLAGLLVSWQALTVSLVIGGLLIIAAIRVNRLSRQAGIKLVDANSRLTGTVIEGANLLKYIKGSAAEGQILTQFDHVISEVADLTFRQIIYQEFIQNYPDIIEVTVISILIYLIYIFFGNFSGDYIFFLLLAKRAYSRIAAMQSARRRAIQNIPSYEACVAMLDGADRRQEPRGGRRFEGLRERIELRHVEFSFLQSGPIIQGVNLEIAKSSMVALVGRSGAGKTTLVDLILGLHRPTEGAVLVDDVDLWSYDIGSWRKRIGFVPQDPILFNGSISDNIRLPRPSASLQDVQAAARAAHATEFIDALPEGFDTLVGDLGAKLSGGQKQRIALARALIRDPEILILDEATSALDARSEQRIQDAILSLRGRITVIVIAHRLTTVERADRIFVIKDGRVAESGTFQELKNRGGEFAKLHALGT